MVLLLARRALLAEEAVGERSSPLAVGMMSEAPRTSRRPAARRIGAGAANDGLRCYMFVMSIAANPPPTPEVVEAIETILRKRLSRFGYRGARIRAGLDHTGEPTLFIDADYDYSDELLDSAETHGANLDLVYKLPKLGERRFPHVRHHFDGRQKVLGFDR
jgi:hypothetical protein